MLDIDALGHRIDDKSKTTAQRLGTKFHARVIKHFHATWEAGYDIAMVTDNRFIKELYKMFTKYQSASLLEKEFFVKQIDNIKGEVDEYFDDRPLPAEDPPLIEADIPDDADAKIPTGRICRRCETSNPPGGE
ncbi:MAG TPA: hypothetical protein VJZ68_07675 [Nitrososphaera sp.]|nr:hypothetical protein [Nitrososphaera sp.]